jgi:hypothetical protein
MPSALETFRVQREAVDQVHSRLTEVAELLRALRAQVDAIAQDQALRQVLRDEEHCLESARRTFAEVRALRQDELRRFWPAVWASRPYEAELASLRTRVELLDVIAHRVITMTPAERRQFDALMRQTAPAPRR